MNIKKLKSIIDQDNLPNDLKESLILSEIAKDENVIPTLLTILNSEREENRELLEDQNAELSRALVLLMDENLKTSKGIIVEPSFVVGKIRDHYMKWKDKVTCNFQIKDLP